MTDDQQPDQAATVGRRPDGPTAGSEPGRPEAGSEPGRPEAGSEPGRPEAGSEPGRPGAGSEAGRPGAGSEPGRPEAGRSEAGWPESGGGEPAGPRLAGRGVTLGDADMPAAGRRPAPNGEPPSASSPEQGVDGPLDPHAPLSADGPTVRLASALPPLAATAGASPPGPAEPADKPVAAGDEPTVISPPAERDDEPTTRLTPPPAPAAAAAGPARRASGPRSLDDGETRRLQPPFFAPDTTRTPRPAADSSADAVPHGDPVGRDASWHGRPAGATDDGADREALERRPEDLPGGGTSGRGQGPSAAGEGFDDAADDRGVRGATDAGEPADDGGSGSWPPVGSAGAAADSFAEPVGSTGAAADSFAEPVGSAGAAAGSFAGPVGSTGAVAGGAGDGAANVPEKADVPDKAGVPEKGLARQRFTPAGALIWLLLALLGFTLVVQLRSNDDDGGLATARQEDLVGILSDLEARDQRLQQEINALEESQRQLTSGVAGRQAALAEAGKRADELGLLSGTLPARGPGLKISIDPRGQPIKASALLNAVQELRGAGGEVMEIIGDNGVAVRIVASSYFVDAAGGQVVVDGKELSGPYTLWVIGVPSTMQTALQIPGGVVASVSQAGGNVTMEQRNTVEVTAVRQPTSLQYARPVS